MCQAGAVAWWVVSVGYVGVLVAKGVTLLWAAGQLPERPATHFGASGRPDGWMRRRSFLILDGVLAVVVLIGVPVLVSVLARAGDAGLSIPHRDYWTSAAHHDPLVSMLDADGLGIAAITGLLLVWMDVALVRANRLTEPRLPASLWVAVALYVAAVGVGVAWITLWQFRLPG